MGFSTSPEPGLEGKSRGCISEPARQTVALGFLEGSTHACYPGQKGKLSSPVTPDKVENEDVLEIQHDLHSPALCSVHIVRARVLSKLP